MIRQQHSASESTNNHHPLQHHRHEQQQPQNVQPQRIPKATLPSRNEDDPGENLEWSSRTLSHPGFQNMPNLIYYQQQQADDIQGQAQDQVQGQPDNLEQNNFDTYSNLYVDRHQGCSGSEATTGGGQQQQLFNDPVGGTGSSSCSIQFSSSPSAVSNYRGTSMAFFGEHTHDTMPYYQKSVDPQSSDIYDTKISNTNISILNSFQFCSIQTFKYVLKRCS